MTRIPDCPACVRPITECICDEWCDVCLVVTNHSTEQHRNARRDLEREEP